MTTRNCNNCGSPVDLDNPHPDSLPVPIDDTEFTVLQAGCAAGDDAWSGANPSDEDLADKRAWIKTY
jgi:hypothetical protein